MSATLVYYRHVEGGAVVSYDKGSLDEAIREAADPGYAAAAARRRKGRQHHLIEIAKQVRKGTLAPCAAPKATPRLPEVDPATEAEIVAEEKRLKRERLERELAELEDTEPEDTVPYIPSALEADEYTLAPADDVETPFGDVPEADPMNVDGGAVVAGGKPSSTKPRARRGSGA